MGWPPDCNSEASSGSTDLTFFRIDRTYIIVKHTDIYLPTIIRSEDNSQVNLSIDY